MFILAKINEALKEKAINCRDNQWKHSKAQNQSKEVDQFCQINIAPAMDNVHWVRESFSAFKAKKGQGGSAELINAKQRCVSSPRFFRLQVLLEALWPLVDLFLGRQRGSLWREFPLSVFSDERNRCFQRKVIPSWFYNFNVKWVQVNFTTPFSGTKPMGALVQ